MMYPEPLPLWQEEDLQACKIARIECFRFDCELADTWLPGHGEDCQCGLLTISTSNGTCGLGEYAIPCCELKGDVVSWAAVFQRIKGLTIMEGIRYVREKQEAWGTVRQQLIESALIDLAHKLQKSSHRAKQLKELNLTWNRSYLIDHSQAYISF
ncbi:hypothetical protein GK047_20110 [Paenibacillus sp. SYP-B3998]|uniref:Uncharacterized protein n=1 Tax=Paenibacillus sp. SYP-B3998 TaxID=2678564 RepID=A0A6G4A1V3_9BACL|nr:hypothetical protein [Paenibacillus sp. SYP-B3998]NEW08310.1 hypothetical protein [Paenibacillus sp. SYP-B3998]